MLLTLSSRAAPCSLRWFLAEVSCFCRVLACAVLSLTSFCFRGHPSGAVFTRRHSSRPRLMSLSALSWHSMMSPVVFAGHVRLHRLWLRVDIAGTGESLNCTPLQLSHLCSRSRATTLSAHGVAASGDSATATSVGPSWDGGNLGPSPPVALAGVCTDTCSRPHVHGRLCCTRQSMESHFNQTWHF